VQSEDRDRLSGKEGARFFQGSRQPITLGSSFSPLL
jgi:hypothetical protein